MQASETAESFAALLRRFRLAASLSQEALAVRAGLSSKAVAALERGRRTNPRLETVTFLADALDLSPPDRALLATAARPTGASRTPQSDRTAPDRMRGPAPLALPPTPLIGREHEEAAVLRLLQDEKVRLLTLTGPGGVGKTRLARQVAATLPDCYADGVAFIDLSALRDPALVAGSVAQALGVHDNGDHTARDPLVAHLRDRQVLLVLDNFEQVVEAAPLVADLLETCRRVTALVTSRTALRVRAEQQLRVPPLATPGAGQAPSLESLSSYAAVRLFVARARAVRPDFRLDEASADTVARICRRLDGLPLAIELAAARIAILSPRALLARLEAGPLAGPGRALLAGGARDLPERQQTLRGTLEWSYELLDADERALFARLSVFVGGCTLEAAEAVHVAEGDVLDGVTSLVDKSLLRAEDGPDGETRLIMLETIRDYALERLEASGEAEEMRRRHAAYYLRLAEAAEHALIGPEQAAWLALLEHEHDNLRAALRWSVTLPREPDDRSALARAPEGHGDDERIAAGLRAAGAMWRFWETRGHVTEGRAWLDSLLAREGSTTEADARGKALNGAGVLAHVQGDYARAAAYHQEALALRRSTGDRLGIVASLNNLGIVEKSRGDYARAARLYEEALAILCDMGDQWRLALLLDNMGTVARLQGDYARATALYEETLAVVRERGDAQSVARVLGDLAAVAADQGDHARAAALYRDSLSQSWALNDRRHIPYSLEGLAAIAVANGQPERAARLFGAAEALRETGAAAVQANERDAYERAIGAIRTALGDDAFITSFAEGRALPLEQAIGRALEECDTAVVAEPMIN